MTRIIGRLLALWAIWRGVRADPETARPQESELDPRERRVLADRQAEALVASLLVGAAASALAFVALFVWHPVTPLLGATAGLALTSLAVALMVASLRVVPQVTEVEERPVLFDQRETEEVAVGLRDGVEGVSRRRLLVGAAGVCGCCMGAAAVAPLASLGPRVGDRLAASPWRAGRLLVDEADELVAADRLEVGGFLTAFPQGADKSALGAPVVLVRVDPADLRLDAQRQDWAPRGYLAYSKVCTHAGCAVSEFRSPLSPSTVPSGPALVCPCHYSTFDVTRGAKVVFGPAGRPLPQLPLRIDAQGRLQAAGELSDKPGPAWWGIGGPRV